MTENKFLNQRVGVEFYNKLMTATAFQTNWKAVSPSFYLLQRIATLNDMQEGKPVEFYSINIKNIFQPYCNTSEGDYAYHKYIAALINLKLLVVNNDYIVGDNEGVEGCCKTYLVTADGVDLLSSANVEYLKALHSDKMVIRRVQKNISQRGVMHHTYSDYVLNYIHDGLAHFEYDYATAMAMVTGSAWSKETQQSAECSLIDFKTKDFGKLHYNDSDGRVFNEFVGMKSDLRQTFKYKKMERRAVIDIRACHPTFFSTYILEYFILNTTPYSLHYVGDKADNTYSSIPEMGHYDANGTIYAKTEVTKEDLEKEHQRWLELFTNSAIDPRDVIGASIGRTKGEVKAAMNQTLNGSLRHKKFIQWLQSNYPCLYAVWQSTDVKHTGNNIAKMYESKIMLNADLYKQTEAQNLKLAYEYDGVSIFSAERSQSTFIDQVNYLAKTIVYLAKSVTGVNMVLKVDFV